MYSVFNTLSSEYTYFYRSKNITSYIFLLFLKSSKVFSVSFRECGFTCSACGSCMKSKERIQKFKQTGNLRYIYQNDLDKACIQHDLPYGYLKNFPRRAASDKVLHDKAFNIAKNPKYDEYPCGVIFMVDNFLDKKSFVEAVTRADKYAIKREIISNQRHSDLATSLRVRDN